MSHLRVLLLTVATLTVGCGYKESYRDSVTCQFAGGLGTLEDVRIISVQAGTIHLYRSNGKQAVITGDCIVEYGVK